MQVAEVAGCGNFCLVMRLSFLGISPAFPLAVRFHGVHASALPHRTAFRTLVRSYCRPRSYLLPLSFLFEVRFKQCL